MLQKVFSLILLVSCLSARATDKTKTYHKSYPLAAGDNVRIHNKFGKVDVHIWDKPEIQVDVTITVTGEEDAEATRLLDRINIEDGKQSSGVFFETSIDNEDVEEKKHHSDRRKFTIDYSVSMPAIQTLRLSDEFGAIVIPDYKGAVDLTSKFGSLEAGRLESVKSLDVEFGKATIAGMHDGDVTIKFSKADISEISGDVHATFNFCDVMHLGATTGLKSLDIDNSYTSLRIGLPSGLPASFNISTHFGSLENNSSYQVQEETADSFRKTYRGKSGDGSVSIRINTDFSTIHLGN
jgi:hypothetical protein